MRDLLLMVVSSVIVVLLCFSHFSGVHSQAYHFSNGWNPGKRTPPRNLYDSDDTSVSESQSERDQCRIRPQIEKLILDLMVVSLFIFQLLSSLV